MGRIMNAGERHDSLHEKVAESFGVGDITIIIDSPYAAEVTPEFTEFLKKRILDGHLLLDLVRANKKELGRMMYNNNVKKMEQETQQYDTV